MSDREPKNWQIRLKVERPHPTPFTDIVEDPAEHLGTFNDLRITPERRVGVMRRVLRKMIPCYSDQGNQDRYLIGGWPPLKKETTGGLEDPKRGGNNALKITGRKNTAEKRDQSLRENSDQRKEGKEGERKKHRKKKRQGEKKSSLSASPTSKGGTFAPRKLQTQRNGKLKIAGRMSRRRSVPITPMPRNQWRPLPPLPWEVKAKSKTTHPQDSKGNKIQQGDHGDREKRVEIRSPKYPPTFARFKRRCENRFRLQDIREHQMKMRFILRDKAKERRMAAQANKAAAGSEGLQSQADGETQGMAKMPPNRSHLFTNPTASRPRRDAGADAASTSPALHQIVQTVTQSEQATRSRLEQLELGMCKQHEILLTISKLLSQGNAQNLLSQEYGLQYRALPQSLMADEVTGTSSKWPTSTRKEKRTRKIEKLSDSSEGSSSSSSQNIRPLAKSPYQMKKSSTAIPSNKAEKNITKMHSNMPDASSHAVSRRHQSDVADGHGRQERSAFPIKQRSNIAAKTTRRRKKKGQRHEVEMSLRAEDKADESHTSPVQSDISSDLSFSNEHPSLEEGSHQGERGMVRRNQAEKNLSRNKNRDVSSYSKRVARQTITRSEDENLPTGSEDELQKINTSVIRMESIDGTSITARAGKLDKKQRGLKQQDKALAASIKNVDKDTSSADEIHSRKYKSNEETLTEAAEEQTFTSARAKRRKQRQSHGTPRAMVTSTQMNKSYQAETNSEYGVVVSISFDRTTEMRKSCISLRSDENERDFILPEDGSSLIGLVMKQDRKHIDGRRKREQKSRKKVLMSQRPSPLEEIFSDSFESAAPSMDLEEDCDALSKVLEEKKNPEQKVKKGLFKAPTSENDDSLNLVPPQLFAVVREKKQEVIVASITARKEKQDVKHTVVKVRAKECESEMMNNLSSLTETMSRSSPRTALKVSVDATDAPVVSCSSAKSSDDDCSSAHERDTLQPLNLPAEIASPSPRAVSTRKERTLKKRGQLKNGDDTTVKSETIQDSAEIRKDTIKKRPKARRSELFADLKFATSDLDLALTANSAVVNENGITCNSAREESRQKRQFKKTERSSPDSSTKNKDEALADARATHRPACSASEGKVNTGKILKRKKLNDPKPNQIVKEGESLADDENTPIFVQQSHKVDVQTEGDNRVTRHSLKRKEKAARHCALVMNASPNADILDQGDDTCDGESSLQTAESQRTFDVTTNMHLSHGDKDENVNTEQVSDDLVREESADVQIKTDCDTEPLHQTASSSEEAKAGGTVKPKGRRSRRKRRTPKAWKKFTKEQGLHRKKTKQKRTLSSKNLDAIHKDVETKTDAEKDSQGVTPPFKHIKEAATSGGEMMNNIGETKRGEEENSLNIEKQEEQKINDEEKDYDAKKEESSDNAVKEECRKPHKKRRAPKVWKKIKQEQGLYRKTKRPKQPASPDDTALATGDEIPHDRESAKNYGSCKDKRSHKKRKAPKVWKKIRKEQGLYSRKKKPKQPASPDHAVLATGDEIPHDGESAKNYGSCKDKMSHKKRKAPKVWKKIKTEQGLYRKTKRPKQLASPDDTALATGDEIPHDGESAKNYVICKDKGSHKKRKAPKVWKKIKTEQGLYRRKKKPKQPTSPNDPPVNLASGDETGDEIPHVGEVTPTNGDTCKAKKPHKKLKAPKVWKEFKKEQGVHKKKKKQKQAASQDTAKSSSTGNEIPHCEFAQKNDDISSRELFSSKENKDDGVVNNCKGKKLLNEQDKTGAERSTEHVPDYDTSLNDSKLSSRSSKPPSLWKTFKKEQGLFNKPKKHADCCDEDKDILAERVAQKKEEKKEKKKQEEEARKRKKRLMKGGLGKLLKRMKGKNNQKSQIEPQLSDGKTMPSQPALEPCRNEMPPLKTSPKAHPTTRRPTATASAVSDDGTAGQRTSHGTSNPADNEQCGDTIATGRHQEHKHAKSRSSSTSTGKTLSTSEMKEQQDDKMASQKLTILNKKSLTSEDGNTIDATQPRQDQRRHIMHQILQELSSSEDTASQTHNVHNDFDGDAESRIGIPSEGTPTRNLSSQQRWLEKPEDHPEFEQDKDTLSSDDVKADQILTDLPPPTSKHGRGVRSSGAQHRTETEANFIEKEVSVHLSSAASETREQSLNGNASSTLKQPVLIDPVNREVEDGKSGDNDNEEVFNKHTFACKQPDDDYSSWDKKSDEEEVDQRTQEKTSKEYYTSFEIEMMDELLSELSPSGEEPTGARELAGQNCATESSRADPSSEKEDRPRPAVNKLGSSDSQLSNMQQSSQKYTSLNRYKILGDGSKFPTPTSKAEVSDTLFAIVSTTTKSPENIEITNSVAEEQFGSYASTEAESQSTLPEMHPGDTDLYAPEATRFTVCQLLESEPDECLSASSVDCEGNIVETRMENANMAETFPDGYTQDRLKASLIQAGKPGSISAFQETEIPRYLREDFNPTPEQKSFKRWDPMTAKNKLSKISQSKKKIPVSATPSWLKTDFNPDGSAPKREAWKAPRGQDALCSTTNEVSGHESNFDYTSLTPEAKERGRKQIEKESQKIINSMKSQEKFKQSAKAATTQLFSAPSSGDTNLPKYLRVDFDPAPDQKPFERWNPDDANEKLNKISSKQKGKKGSQMSTVSSTETPRWLQPDFHPEAGAPTSTPPRVPNPAQTTKLLQSESGVEAVGLSNVPPWLQINTPPRKTFSSVPSLPGVKSSSNSKLHRRNAQMVEALPRQLAFASNEPAALIGGCSLGPANVSRAHPADRSANPSTSRRAPSTELPRRMKPGWMKPGSAWQDSASERRTLLNSIADTQAATTRPCMMSN